MNTPHLLISNKSGKSLHRDHCKEGVKKDVPFSCDKYCFYGVISWKKTHTQTKTTLLCKRLTVYYSIKRSIESLTHVTFVAYCFKQNNY